MRGRVHVRGFAGAWLVLAILAGAAATDRGRLAEAAPSRGKITIAWAKWAPSDYLTRLARDFTKETRIQVEVKQIPWSRFQNVVLNQVWPRKSSAYDLIVGDSQWLGRGATEGHYVDLTEWSNGHVPWQDIPDAAEQAYCRYDDKVYAVPCEGDAPGFAYRRDLFENETERAGFQLKYGRELRVPTTWAEFRDVAEWFTRPEQGLYGTTLFFDGRPEAYDTVTMGFDQVLWSFGGELRDPDTGQVTGTLNNAAGVQALTFFRDLKAFTPPGSEMLSYDDYVRAFSEGRVAMSQNWVTFFPAYASRKTNRYATRTGYFLTPAGPSAHVVSLGGQGISLSAYSKKKGLAKAFLAWFSKESNQKKWARFGGLSVHREVLEDLNFQYETPYNRVYSQSVPLLRDFYNNPKYAELLAASQEHLYAAIRGEVTPQAALDALAAEQQAILTGAGL